MIAYTEAVQWNGLEEADLAVAGKHLEVGQALTVEHVSGADNGNGSHAAWFGPGNRAVGTGEFGRVEQFKLPLPHGRDRHQNRGCPFLAGSHRATDTARRN